MDINELMNTEMINEFQENDEWDDCFNAVENWDQEQDLIAKSNAVDDEEAPRAEYLEVLNRCFGHKSFRPMQWKIISSIINDKRDNCAIMATGYGKSLCFQYPSVYIGGVTIVVSPLISLMEDQVLSLEMSNIPACLLGSAQTNKRQVIDDIFDNKYSLVYLTPEFCCGDYGQDLLKRMNQNLPIILIAIDEAHCVSSWGHDFRYTYRELGKIRQILPNVPILAVTATATPKVRIDIVSCLKLKNAQVLCSGFDRPNLQFTVYLKGSQGILPDLRKVMTDKSRTLSFPGSTIIYCITRKQTEEIAEVLQLNGVKCLAYHAGMSITARKAAHEKFVKDKVKIIVATIAFGMGIDKPDVRNIIHYGASKDIESYYQEVGRAGRDGQPSNCITFFKNSDFDLHQAIREMNGTSNKNRDRREGMEKIMIQYLETRDCRRQFILNHFEGSVSPKKPKPKCCDNCTRQLHQTVSDCNKYEGLDEKGLYDFSKDAQIWLSTVDAMGGRFGLGMYILLIRGSKSSKLYEKYHKHPLHGAGKFQTDDWWKAVARVLEREGYLQKSASRKGQKAMFNASTYSVSAKGEKFMRDVTRNPGSCKILQQPTAEMFKLLKRKQQPEPPEEMLFKANPLPSTSTARKTSSSKAPLKLLKLSHKPDSTTEMNNDSDNVSETSENGIEKDERMKTYRLLMNKRTDIASAVDCMPYMVASNEALMKMAQMKPCNIKEFRECRLDGFTEAKIGKFGEEFVKSIRIICQLDPELVKDNVQKSIQDILAEHPLPGAKMAAAAEASYSMYKSGLTVQEIATKRGVLAATILSHLVDAMKAGYPIKMIDLNVTDEMRDVIINVIRSPPINSDTSTITPIKNACPPEVSYDAIKVVIAYLQVREHLAKLKVPYEEFESPPEITTEYNGNNQSQSSKDLDRLLNLANRSSLSSQSSQSKLQTKTINLSSLSTKKYEKRDAENESDESFIFTYGSSSGNPPKKPKLRLSGESNKDLTCLNSPQKHTINSQKTEDNDDLSCLDSPPRTYSTGSQKNGQKSESAIDLEKSLLEDDFFDNMAFDDVDKVIGQAANSKSSQSSTNQNINTYNPETSFAKNSYAISKSPKQVNLISSSPGEKNKFKKFQFKSKVPASVEKSTKQLFKN